MQMSLNQSNSTKEPSRFYPLFLISIVLYVCVFLIADYNKNSMHLEIYRIFMPEAMKTGRALVWTDLTSSFDVTRFDGPRTRFLSVLMMVVNTKFRIWLFHHIPQHPSLSLTWPFTLLFSPWLFFHFLKNYTASKDVAWCGTILYFASIGFLSGITLLFHPAKPMCNFLIILCLYLASELKQKFTEKDQNADKSQLASIGLFLGILTGTFMDEGFFFVLLLFPLFFTQLLKISLFRIVFFAPFLIFIFSVVFLIPQNHGEQSQILNYALFANPVFTVKAYLPEFFLKNAFNLLKTVFYASEGKPLVTLFCVLTLGATVYAYTKLPPPLYRIFHKVLYGLIAFFIFQTLLLARHGFVTQSPFYYSSTFSILAATGLGILVANLAKTSHMAHALLLFTFVSLSLYNFDKINARWNSRETRTQNKLSFKKVKKIWEAKPRLLSEASLATDLPANIDWLNEELRHISHATDELTHNEAYQTPLRP